jgi:hypothetical protein
MLAAIDQELQSILQFVYLGEARFYEGNMDNFMEDVKDLQLAECFMTAGNPFLTRNEHFDDNMSNITFDHDIPATIDEGNATRNTLSTVNEIHNQDIMAYNTGGKSGIYIYIYI